MKPTIQDKSLPHQIQLVFASKAKRCVNGEKVYHSDVVVTCNCYRIGDSDMFVAHIGPAPTVEDAWALWNDVRWHKDKKSFKPHLKEAT